MNLGRHKPQKMAVYKPKKAEDGYIHFKLQNREFDRKTGKPKFKPQLYIANPKDVRIFFENPNGLSILEVLHAPKDFKFPQRPIKDENGKQKMVDYPIYAEYLAEKKPTRKPKTDA